MAAIHADMPSVKSVEIVRGGRQRVLARYPFLAADVYDYATVVLGGFFLRRASLLSCFLELALQCYPQEVCANIFLGGEYCAKQDKVLTDLKLTHIVNATSECRHHFPARAAYFRVPVLDADLAPIADHFDAALAFMAAGLQSGGRVLVHCAQGRSRSVTILLAYLLRFGAAGADGGGLTRFADVDAALAFVQRARPYAQPNDGFLRQLRLAFAPDEPEPELC